MAEHQSVARVPAQAPVYSAFLPLRPMPDTDIVPSNVSMLIRMIDTYRKHGISMVYVLGMEGGWANPAYIRAMHDVLLHCDRSQMAACLGVLKPTKNPMCRDSESRFMGAMEVRQVPAAPHEPTLTIAGNTVSVNTEINALYAVHAMCGKPTTLRWMRTSEPDSRYAEWEVGTDPVTKLIAAPGGGSFKLIALDSAQPAQIVRFIETPPPENQIRDTRGHDGMIDWLGDGSSFQAQRTQPRWASIAAVGRIKEHVIDCWNEFGLRHRSVQNGGLFLHADEGHAIGWTTEEQIRWSSTKEQLGWMFSTLTTMVYEVTGRFPRFWGDMIGGHNDVRGPRLADRSWPGLLGCYANNWRGCFDCSTIDWITGQAKKRMKLNLWGPEKYISDLNNNYLGRMREERFAETTATANDQDGVNEAWAGRQTCWYIEPDGDFDNVIRWIDRTINPANPRQIT